MIFNMILPNSGRSQGLALFQEQSDDLTKTSGDTAIVHEVENFRERLIARAEETARLDESDLMRADHVVMAAMDLLDMDLSEADGSDHYNRLVHNWSLAPATAREQFIGWLNSNVSTDEG